MKYQKNEMVWRGTRLMRGYLAALALLVTLIFSAESIRGASNPPSAFYSKSQAERGKALYGRNCSNCHLENLQGNCPKENLSAGAYVCSARGTAPPLAGRVFKQRFYTIADLYSRVRWTMPGDNVAGLSDADSLDIVAYLLEANGLPAGKDLKSDVTAMKTMVLNESGSPKGPDAKAIEPLNDLGISEGYYTAEQAERGKAYFYGSCAVCHTADPNSPNGNVDASLGMGMLAGSTHLRALLVGDRWLSSNSAISARPQRWDTVADLYSKISSTQPANDMGGLSTQEYLDIVAYIIHQNGFPAGKEELEAGLNQMRNMTLDKGYERLFNGKDLTGWEFVIGNNCAPRPKGCAQITPGTTFKVDEGMLYTSGKPHGYAYPKKQFGPNFTLRLEYRYKAYPGMENDYDFYGNTGYLLFITDHMVWPRTMEIQGKTGYEMSIVQLDGHATYTYDDPLREKVRKPAGEWNAVQIVSKGNEVWTYLNGAQIAHVSAHDWPPTGYIGFEAESAEVHFRNIRIKSE